jgi:hypothetical protein
MKSPIARALASFAIAILIAWRTYSQYVALAVVERTGVGDGGLGRLSKAIYLAGGRNALLATGILVTAILVWTGVQYLREKDKQ